MKTTRKKRINSAFNLLVVIVGLPVFIYLVFLFGQKYYHLQYYEETTYGTIDSVKYDEYDEMTVYYSYAVKKKTYTNTHIRRENPKKVPEAGDSFRVRYSYKKPEISEMIIK